MSSSLEIVELTKVVVELVRVRLIIFDASEIPDPGSGFDFEPTMTSFLASQETICHHLKVAIHSQPLPLEEVIRYGDVLSSQPRAEALNKTCDSGTFVGVSLLL